jgi:glucose-6-phosphate isomerase
MLVVLISKSGNTMETTVNFEWLYALFSKKFGDTWLHRIVVISNDNSTLFLKAQEKKWHTLNIPEKVGGRFSVLTSAGLFPLLVAGFDIQAFVGGAQAGREQALVFSDTNPFLQRAITRYLWYTSGFTIETLFLFSPQLKALGGWYRQLTAESLGKESATTRKLVALFPEVACGPEDLHSTEQLYLGSLRTQSTSFLSIRVAPGNTITDGEGVLEKKEVMGKKVSDIVSAIQQGVEKTYRDHKKPFIKTELATLSLYDLGEFMQGVMIETMLLARLFGVNAFDQPDVEHYKKETQAILRRLS